MAHLAFDDEHETGHQLGTLQQEVEVVKDDLWIPERRRWIDGVSVGEGWILGEKKRRQLMR